MHRHLGDGSTANDNFNASVGDGFNFLFHLFLFGNVVSFQIGGLFNGNGALGVGFGDLESCQGINY